MIGSRIESRRSLPWGSLLFLTGGLCMLGGGLVYRETSLAIASALPLAIGACVLFFGQVRQLSAEFTDDSIEIDDPPTSIPYAAMENVRTGGFAYEPASFEKSTSPIQVNYDGGTLLIPAKLNVPSHQVYRFLAGKVPRNGNRDVNETLAEYLQRQEKQFGPEKVWTYQAKRRKDSKRSYRPFRLFCCGLALAGLIWASLGSLGLIDQGWIPGGISLFVLGAGLLLVTLVDTDLSLRSIKSWKKSSIVIGPQGMAMIQGDVQGEIRWHELLEVSYKAKPSRFYLHSGQGWTGILLKVKGANIVIADIYDRPLYIIHERIIESSGRSAPETIDL
jgi:hypothetical protein